MRLLLISNSTNAGEAYLAYPMPRIGEFLRGVREVAFVPYAAVTFSYADYERRVQARFSEFGIRVRSVHRAADPAVGLVPDQPRQPVHLHDVAPRLDFTNSHHIYLNYNKNERSSPGCTS